MQNLKRIFFHVTTSEAWEKIQKEGLVPQIGLRSEHCQEMEPGIYLFPNLEMLEDALVNWLGEEFSENEELVVLRVELQNERALQFDASNLFEYIEKEKILPENISIERIEPKVQYVPFFYGG